MKNTILLLEDDIGINNLLSIQLRSEGYEVIQTYDGVEAIEKFDQKIDLAILDIMVPLKDGFEVMAHIRSKSIVPIIFLTAKNGDIEKMKALDFGADDYVTKPFSVVEVIYRCKAHLRRYHQFIPTAQSELLEHGDIVLDKKTFEVTFCGKPLQMNAKEFELLAFFMSNVGQVFTKKQLYEHVWNDDFFGDHNTVMVHISRLREKLGDPPKSPKYIKTIKGLGYRMEKI